MTYRVFVIGDPHFKENNKIHTEEMVTKVLVKVKELKPDLIINLGDTEDRFSNINSYAHKDACDFIFALSEIAPTYVLIGNHDRPNTNDFLSDYHPYVAMRNQHNITIVHKPMRIFVPELEGYIVFMPYVPSGRFLEALIVGKETWGDWDNTVCIFAHQEIRDCVYNKRKSFKGDVWPKNAPLIISGHIHKYQRVGKNVWYVGTPMQESFGDLDRKSVAIVSFTNERMKIDIDNTEYPIRCYEYPSEERIYLGIKERQELRMPISDVWKWHYTDDYIWHLKLEGTESEINLFQLSKKYSKLNQKGVKLSVYVKRNFIDKEYEETIAHTDFRELLWNRIEGKEGLKIWLEEILNE